MKAHPISELRARMSKSALAESERLYRKLSTELALREIREAAGLSQEDMAGRLKTDQAAVSRMERRSDARVSTIARYVEAAGGRLRMVADIGGRMVELSGFDIPEPAPARRSRRA